MTKKYIKSLFGDILLGVGWFLILLNLFVDVANDDVDHSLHITALLIYPAILLSYHIKEMFANE